VAGSCEHSNEPSGFLKGEGSFLRSQEPTTGPYPEPDESNPHTTHIFVRSVLIFSSYLYLGLASGFFPSGVPIKILYSFLMSPKRGICPTALPMVYMLHFTIYFHIILSRM
jgi:hypothetical protein